MNAASDKLRIVSHFPGRLRVRAETFRILPEIANEVAERLAEQPGVTSARSVPLTGSLVVTYDPRQLQLLELVQNLVRLGGLHGIEVDAGSDEVLRGPDTGQKVRRVLSDFNSSLRIGTKDAVDLNAAMPATLAALGIATLIWGNRRLPEWYDFMFWSFTTFQQLNPPATPPARSDSDRRDGGPASTR